MLKVFNKNISEINIIELERYWVKSIKGNNKFVFCLKYWDGYWEFLEYLK